MHFELALGGTGAWALEQAALELVQIGGELSSSSASSYGNSTFILVRRR